jgi:peptide/nickel transport system ATP-binding protein
MTAVLEVRHLSVGAGGRRIVDDVSLTLASGQVLGLVGESGSGKSMTVLAALGLMPPGVTRVAGTVSLLGHDPAAMPGPALRALLGARVGFVPQDPLSALDPLFTVGDQITARDRLCGARPRRGAVWREAARGLLGGGADAAAMLAEVGLDAPERRQRQYPHQLSGGMRQRAQIAAAMRPPPALVIADEPTTALDASIERQVLDLLLAEVRARGAALLLISHDLNVVGNYCDVALVMQAGRVVEGGDVETLFRRPRQRYTRELLQSMPGLKADAAPVAERPPTPALLELHAVGRRYDLPRGGSLLACNNATLTVRRGEFVALVGESGSGKSTLARLALRLERPDTGRVVFDGQDLASLGDRALRTLRRRFAPVFQDPLSSLNPRWTVGRSILHPLRIHGLCGWPSQAAALATLLGEIGLPDIAERRPAALSGGQRQRVCIARALVTRPDLIVADECLSGLDATTAAAILGLLARLRRRFGTALLFISHDLRTVRRVSDRVVVMRSGEIVEQGTPDQVLGAPRHPYTQALVSSLLAPPFAEPAGTRKTTLAWVRP